MNVVARFADAEGPDAGCLDRLPRSAAFWRLLLEVRDHVLGAVGSPQGEGSLVRLVEVHVTKVSDRVWKPGAVRLRPRPE